MLQAGEVKQKSIKLHSLDILLFSPPFLDKAFCYIDQLYLYSIQNYIPALPIYSNYELAIVIVESLNQAP